MNIHSLFLAAVLAFSICFPAPARTPLLAEEESGALVVVDAKIILPMTPPVKDAGLVVEPWIARKLRQAGAADLRAVTGWVRISAEGGKSTRLWNSVVDGKLHGCAVNGEVKTAADGKMLSVDLTGWTPVGAHVEGAVVPSLPGSRRIATVRVAEGDEKVHAWVVLVVHAAGDGPGSKR